MCFLHTPITSIILQNHIISYCISGERAPSVVRPAKPGGEVFRYAGFLGLVIFVSFFFSFTYLSFHTVFVLRQDEIRVKGWGDGGKENSDSGYCEAWGGSEVPERRAGYFSSPQKKSVTSGAIFGKKLAGFLDLLLAGVGNLKSWQV